MTNIKENFSCNVNKKLLLIMNNFESHFSIKAIDFTRENSILILAIPPHTSNKLQPLDRTVFGPFKPYFSQSMNSWMMQNPGKPITIYDLAPLTCSSWDKAATRINVKSAFRCTGIHTLDN